MTIVGFLDDEKAAEMRAYFESCPRGYLNVYSFDELKDVLEVDTNNVRLIISLIGDALKSEDIVSRCSSFLEQKGFLFLGHHEDINGISYYFTKTS